MLFRQLARSFRAPFLSTTRFCRWNTSGNAVPDSFAAQADLEVSSQKRTNFVASINSFTPENPEEHASLLDAGIDPSFMSERQYASSIIHGRGVHFPVFHEPTHHVPVANIHFRSHHPELLELFTHFATHAASSLGIPISRVVYLPTQRTLWTVLRSPFVHKKKQENFERRVHKRAIKAWDAHPDVVDMWCQYLRKHALGGVGMRVTRWDRMPLGVGKKMKGVQGGKDATPRKRIRTLGEQIVNEEQKATRKVIGSQ